ncbi:DUF6890 family protein [Aeromonas veronii]
MPHDEDDIDSLARALWLTDTLASPTPLQWPRASPTHSTDNDLWPGWKN